MNEIIVVYNRPEEAFIKLKDKRGRWPSCANENLLKYLGRGGETIKRVQFTDEEGIGDGLLIYF